MENIVTWLIAYLVAVSLLSVIYTVVDKRQARRGGWRVAESTLFLIAVMGGAAAMLFTMRCIRHKTRHRRFMWGLPFVTMLHIVALLWFVAK